LAYVTYDEVKVILANDLIQYPDQIDNHIEYAEAKIDSRLLGSFDLRFDDVSLYDSVPVQIKWIAALLVGWRLWDQATPLEGQQDSTAGTRWKREAEDWLKCLVKGDCGLTLDDGTLIGTSDSMLPRAYPTGTRDKAPSAANVPWFTRAQAHEW
jgi:hypothetical protein